MIRPDRCALELPDSRRDAHEVVAASQRIAVPAMLTINDAAC